MSTYEHEYRTVNLDLQAHDLLLSIANNQERMADSLASLAESLALIAESVSHPSRIVMGTNQEPSQLRRDDRVTIAPHAKKPFSLAAEDEEDDPNLNSPSPSTVYVVENPRDRDGDVVLRPLGGRGFFWVRPSYVERSQVEVGPPEEHEGRWISLAEKDRARLEEARSIILRGVIPHPIAPSGATTEDLAEAAAWLLDLIEGETRE